MKRRTFLAASTLAAIGATAKVDFAQTRTPQPDVAGMLEVTKVPGIAVAGVLHGKTFQQFAGLRQSGAPINADTYFPAASLSKPVFAWAVRDLVKQGKLDLHKPLQDYLDLGLTGEAKKVTAEHCLAHTTGFANWRFQPDRALASDFTPGTRWQYSGDGYFALQRVVEKLVGVPIARYMKSSVLTPLGMTSSTFAWTPELQSKAAIGHDSQGQPLERSLAFYERHNFETLQKVGLTPEAATYEQIVLGYEKAKAVPLTIALSPNMAGSLQTTAGDYAKFLAAVSSDLAKRPEDFKSRIEVNNKISWTLGLGVDKSFGALSYFHWGDGPGFKNFAWLQPATKTSLVFLTNGDRGASLYAWLFRKLLDEDPAAFYWI
jgi:CubicO group peptidase (beta-lactamase class C family)